MVERREITRTRVRREVLIFNPDLARAIDGTVRNLTAKGAGLERSRNTDWDTHFRNEL